MTALLKSDVQDLNKVNSMRKVFNFSAGPAMLPEEVLLTAQREMLDWQGTGMSIMELGHRGPEFKMVAEKAEADLRELMSIPSHYHVLFLAGGATTQFAMVPLNLFNGNDTADYIDTGVWSKKAIAEASRYGVVNVAAQTELRDNLACIPDQSHWNVNPGAAYLHYTPNETIDGLEFQWVPKTGNVPLVADMTSMILSRPVKVSDFGIIYAGAQKNVGQAGLTIVIIRGDLISELKKTVPTLYSYQLHAEHHSFYNTPPTYSWYISGLVLDWMKRHGGVEAMYQKNLRNARTLYTLIDEHKDFYVNRIQPACRSLMNVMFYLQDDKLTALFLEEAEQSGLTNLRGHRVTGGVRASIYNAMPEEGVKVLADFMRSFARRYG
ncbi:Phosphoserine aminotransferase [Aquicella siphonis]|uniref:Phosphoserine aminotransferase n=2 Tax=Aquicella siphonis TaxID=254247 RepID=A0A5E4PHM4_9COXI|nr:Phosphoserine aminotransferase [Aquicella siphonis]